MTSSPNPSSANFEPTRWTMVMQARGNSADSKGALQDLCAAYWNPVFRFLRCEGHSEDESQELTQAFFARLLERGGLEHVDPTKGRFRSYLLGALKHFLSAKRRDASRQKRGGGIAIESLNSGGSETSPGMQLADPGDIVSSKTFDREWALTVMQRALESVQTRFHDTGKSAHFDTLKPWLVGDTENLSQADAAEALGLSAGAVKVAIHRLRSEFRGAVETEIRQTLNGTDDLADELRYLIDVLS